ncbi:MAG: hypothetical protein OdinLCB4_006410 [Candidatus Odinarchaeum yellowstonii]|uniref:Hydantoinase A/oxoprolinase domain-containing protein n=1 Tax=Odinarchaeota yellowstonii (strain LCB_4) TaxID=1841599 RepID=A0AAF0D1Y0_ODILC|nr:MAG: hypothetical protein OdinLCB4_006410 [Candidatus Odinarchaeum yellowstonii]
MTVTVGVDVGGANTKIALINSESKPRSLSFYFPFWKRSLSDYPEVFLNFLQILSDESSIDFYTITMTAELCDVFKTRREGVVKIVRLLSSTLPVDKLFFYTVDDSYVNAAQALENPLKLAASNWVATGRFFSQYHSNCVIIDMGSTTTDLIIVENGEVYSKGVSDLKRLLNGELYYTGLLRTPLCALANQLSFKRKKCSVAAELFAITADIHLILGNINPEQYTCDTPDNAEKTAEASYRRISRMLCSDIEELSRDEILKIAADFEGIQFKTIRRGVERLLRVHRQLQGEPVILTGIGRRWLYKMFKTYKPGLNLKLSDEIVEGDVSDLTPAYAVAYLWVKRRRV